MMKASTVILGLAMALVTSAVPVPGDDGNNCGGKPPGWGGNPPGWGGGKPPGKPPGGGNGNGNGNGNGGNNGGQNGGGNGVGNGNGGSGPVCSSSTQQPVCCNAGAGILDAAFCGIFGGNSCSGTSYCCNNDSNGFINIDLFNCAQIL